MPILELLSRAEKLKQAIVNISKEIDHHLLALSPTTDLDNYKKFLTLQYSYQVEVESLYQHVDLHKYVDNLFDRTRLPFIEQDLNDLKHPLPNRTLQPRCFQHTDFAYALGWLYVIEGSQFSATTLGKQVEAELKLNNQRGARYLAKASECNKGCQLSHLIDNLELSDEQQATLIEGAEQARQRFKFYQAQFY
ncbi:biliverdin-producing heme oxygenase [Pseudoalteromonas gelatinilytica]|uniref:Heme oxygenase n=1 Tax=Pseudoalteromonas gelatinilytica TaxID=1703256 RepID=A0ABQ1TPY0_9GAMM|nr:biliverdin-producing heme oxygenase [Pseudoalteromonas profundi]GGE98347.1 heme oxygenase [Pseudoalteromonas profundi]